MAEPTARAAVERLLRCSLPKTSGESIGGCMLVQGALVCSESAAAVKLDLASRRRATELVFKQRFERAVAEKELPKATDVAALAKYISIVQHGIAVQTAGGACADELRGAVEIALRAWPSESTADRSKK